MIAAEPRSKRAALWRYRIASLLLLLVFAAVVLWAFLKLSNVTGGEDPGIGLRPARPVTAAG